MRSPRWTVCNTRPCIHSFGSFTTAGACRQRRHHHDRNEHYTGSAWMPSQLNEGGCMVTAMSVMTRDLAKVAHSATVLDAAKMMRERKIGSVFIEQNDRIVGIVTEADIVRRAIGVGHMPGFIPVSTIMSSPVIGI